MLEENQTTEAIQKYRCVTTHVPMELWKRLDTLCQANPGLTRNAVMKAIIASALKNPAAVHAEIGKY